MLKRKVDTGQRIYTQCKCCEALGHHLPPGPHHPGERLDIFLLFFFFYYSISKCNNTGITNQEYLVTCGKASFIVIRRGLVLQKRLQYFINDYFGKHAFILIQNQSYLLPIAGVCCFGRGRGDCPKDRKPSNCSPFLYVGFVRLLGMVF